MLLWVVNPQFVVREKAVDLTGDIALETSHRFLLDLPSFVRRSMYSLVRGS
jgi:hypothetical protein